MSDADDIQQDAHFVELALSTTSSSAFISLLNEHARGYTQRKRVLAGLKDMLAKVEALETKVIAQKAVGKGKSTMDKESQTLYDNYKPADLKEKVQALNASIKVLIEEGKFTAEEKPQISEELTARLAKAVADGKEELQQKLEQSIAKVSEAVPKPLPMPDSIEIDTLKKKLRTIHQLEAKDWYSLNEQEQNMIWWKDSTIESLKSIEDRNRMWFETASEYKARLQQALLDVPALKLEMKRLERKDLPQKPKPEPKVKVKKQVAKVNPYELFQNAHLQGGEDPVEPQQNEEEAEGEAEGEAEEQAAEQQNEAVAEQPEARTESPPVPAPSPEPEKKPKQQKAKVEAAPPVWSKPAVPQDELSESADPALPALGAPVVKEAPVKKTPPPQPKKKEKKKFTKADPSLIGFEVD